MIPQNNHPPEAAVPGAKGSPTHPLARKTERSGGAGVRKEQLQPWFPVLAKPMVGADSEQIYTQPIQRVAKGLPVVIDGIQGAVWMQSNRLGQWSATIFFFN